MPSECKHNAHMFYIKVKDLTQRTELLEYLKKSDIFAVFHYVPLHSSPFGEKVTKFYGCDDFTTSESEKIIRLPLWYGMKNFEFEIVVAAIYKYFEL